MNIKLLIIFLITYLEEFNNLNTTLWKKILKLALLVLSRVGSILGIVILIFSYYLLIILLLNPNPNPSPNQVNDSLKI